FCIIFVRGNKTVKLFPDCREVLPDIEVPFRAVGKNLGAEDPGKEPVIRDNPGTGVPEKAICLRGLSRTRDSHHTEAFSSDIHAGSMDRAYAMLVLEDVTAQTKCDGF